jgi:hypothetical protein
MRQMSLSLGRLLRLTSVVVMLVMACLHTPSAEAAVKGCRSDPVVILSDGTVLDIQVAVGTHVSNVKEIRYVVHGPPGVWLVAAIRTPMLGFTGKETFVYYADSEPHTYVTEALVKTTDNFVPVTAYTTFAATALLDGGDLLSVQYRPISGFNNEVLRAVLRG